MSRQYTNRLYELIEEGIFSKNMLLDELTQYLSEDEIKDFCLNGFGCEYADFFKGCE